MPSCSMPSLSCFVLFCFLGFVVVVAIFLHMLSDMDFLI